MFEPLIRLNKQVQAYYRGVKQGCNLRLSPLLFSLYINSLPERIHPAGDIRFPTSCVLFADDVVVFSDDPHTLQNISNSLDTFCKQLSLQIITVKTKILVFGEHPKKATQLWKIDNNTVDIVNSYHLGTWLSWKGDFKICLDKIIQSYNFILTAAATAYHCFEPQ